VTTTVIVPPRTTTATETITSTVTVTENGSDVTGQAGC
jgi:hypothetical protein